MVIPLSSGICPLLFFNHFFLSLPFLPSLLTLAFLIPSHLSFPYFCLHIFFPPSLYPLLMDPSANLHSHPPPFCFIPSLPSLLIFTVQLISPLFSPSFHLLFNHLLFVSSSRPSMHPFCSFMDPPFHPSILPFLNSSTHFPKVQCPLSS